MRPRRPQGAQAPGQSSLFRRLMLGFSAVILAVAMGGMAYVLVDAKATQSNRTAAENRAHAIELLLHLERVAGDDAALRASADAIERVRQAMFHELDYHSQVRVRVWRGEQLVYNSRPDLPDVLPQAGSPEARHANAWVSSVERDPLTQLVVERTHEVDDEWMLSISGVTFLLSSTVFSLPLLLVPAWLIVGIGLRPLRSIAQAIELRSATDLTPLADSKYKELSPLVSAINQLMARLRQRVENELEFLTDAAHELKTPLAAIQLNAHLLQNPTASGTAQRHAEVSAGLREGVARATHLVHQLLALERARAEPDGELPPRTALDAVVRDRLAMAAPLALQRDIEIEFQADADCVRPVHLESMAALLDNLISNAIKYSPAAGRIHVYLQCRAENGCRLTIADDGPGIPPHLRQKVFERFYRIPGQEATGSGLGLAIAERAAHRNEAHITLSSGEGGRGLLATVDFLAEAA
jgi:two-component system sensor histidine kinase QseC